MGRIAASAGVTSRSSSRTAAPCHAGPSKVARSWASIRTSSFEACIRPGVAGRVRDIGVWARRDIAKMAIARRADQRPPVRPWRRRSGALSRRTRALAQPQQQHESQAETRPQHVEDEIVHVCRSIAPPCSRHVLKELDAARHSDRDLESLPEAKMRPNQREQDAERDEEEEIP